MIYYTAKGNYNLNVYYENGVKIGEILQKDDGYYDFWPELRGGCWSGPVLQRIAEKLKVLNGPWEKQIEEYFSNECSPKSKLGR
jgi:hypothetical protein